jgi:hypothetical protein
MLWLGAILFAQLDDDGQNFIMAYANKFNKMTRKKYNSMKGSALLLLGGFTILMLSITNVKMNHQSFKFLMESNQFIRKLDRFNNMILR